MQTGASVSLPTRDAHLSLRESGRGAQVRAPLSVGDAAQAQCGHGGGGDVLLRQEDLDEQRQQRAGHDRPADLGDRIRRPGGGSFSTSRAWAVSARAK